MEHGSNAAHQLAIGLSHIARAVEMAAVDEEASTLAAAQAVLGSLMQYPIVPGNLPLSASPMWQESVFEVIYVNLRTRKDRREHIERELQKAGLRASRLDAATGDDTPDSCVARTWDSTLNAAFDTKTCGHPCVVLSPGERGCAMSHRTLWELSASRPDTAPPLLILEDDAVLTSQCPALLLRLLRAIHATWVNPASRTLVLYLCADVAKWSGQPLQIDPGLGLRESSYQWQTAAYLIWPPAARALLAGAHPIDCPVDVYMARATLHREVRSFLTQPQLARQAQPFQNGDVLHSNFYQPHVHVDDKLRAALEANQAALDTIQGGPAASAEPEGGQESGEGYGGEGYGSPYPSSDNLADHMCVTPRGSSGHAATALATTRPRSLPGNLPGDLPAVTEVRATAATPTHDGVASEATPTQAVRAVAVHVPMPVPMPVPTDCIALPCATVQAVADGATCEAGPAALAAATTAAAAAVAVAPATATVAAAAAAGGRVRERQRSGRRGAGGG